MNIKNLPIESKSLIPLEKPLRYDPEAIAKKYNSSKIRVLKRWLEILLPIISFVIQWWWYRLTRQSKQHLNAIKLRETLTNLGTAYIKVGQALSTRPDLLPTVYLEELTKLQDELPAFPTEIAYQFILEELGAAPEQVYAELSQSPIAAASLGQVYRGKLKTGETVAVKVQRPDLADKIALDMYILRGLTVFLEKRFSKIRTNLVAILDEFGARLFEEMDYVQEGHNAEKFASLYSNITDVYVPKIYWQYTNRRVLTMEWIQGTKLTHVSEIHAQGINARHLVEVGIQCTLRQLLEHGFFHADPHPGNLLAMENGKLAYLDFGMMSYIQPYQRYALINALVHVVNRDFTALVQDYIDLDFLPPDVDVTPVRAALTTLFNDALTSNVAELNFQVIIQQLSELMYEHSFQVPAYYALIIRALVALEGIAMKIDPNFKVLVSAYPYVAKRLLTDSAPELRTSLNNLLFKDGSFRWNRLERLLSNARNHSDYNLNSALDQAIDFLFSDRGEYIRIRLADELIQIFDTLGETILYRANVLVHMQIDSPNSNLITRIDSQTLSYIKKIWKLLKDSPGFNFVKLTQAIAKILVKPETHQLGHYLISALLQRTFDRLFNKPF
ncbi:ABC-1 domain-containing protein [Calothrix sp. NIES-4071]|nr:ABC-1 domain-containing protein [Calothrix sp. NIES-4071]BAZ57851.1 ABC-1 domain-containing protein [Calothrix sp. NIES-4105]